MSQAIKIGSGNKKASNNVVPQSLPANFYRGYVPPKTPKINPIPEPANLNAMPALAALPPSSQKNTGIDLMKGSFSLKNNTHPMSMPVHSGLMGPLKNRIPVRPSEKNKKHDAIPEAKEDDLTSNFAKMIGSYTTFQIMGGDNQSMSSFADQSDRDELNDSANNKDANLNMNSNKNDTDANNDATMADSGILKSAQNGGDNSKNNNNNNDSNDNTNLDNDMDEEEDDQFDMED